MSLFHHDATLRAPRWMPWVFSLQFRVSFMPSVPGFGTWHSSRAHSRHGSYTLSLKRLKAFTLSEQTSGQMTTTNRHSINSTNNKHVILYPVIAVSHWSYVRRLPIQTMHTNCQQDFSEDIVAHFLNHSVYCMCLHLAIACNGMLAILTACHNLYRILHLDIF